MDHLNQSNLQGEEIANYLLIEVNNDTLEDKLSAVTIHRPQKQIIVWNLIHITLSFFHEFGPFFNNESFQILLKIYNYSHFEIVEKLSLDFIIIFYHQIIALYGLHDEGETFRAPIRAFADSIERNEDITFALNPSEQDLQVLPFPFNVVIEPLIDM